MRLARRIAPILFLLVAPGAIAADAALRAVTLDDLEAVKSLSGLAPSRDGRQIAYVVDGQVLVIASAGGAPRSVTAAGFAASDPYWTRDGRSLWFVTDRSGTDQVWKLPVDAFGEAAQLTTFGPGIDAVDPSPDESRLLVVATEEAMKQPAREEKPDAGAKEAPPPPFVVSRLEMKEDDGEGYLTGDRAEHLFALEIATGRLTQVTSGPWTESDPAWSPDGRTIAFVSNRERDPDESYRTDVWLVAAGNADRDQSLVRLTNDDRVKSHPAWSPDGRAIAFLSAVDGVYGMPQVAVIPAAGGEARLVTAPLDRWVDSFHWSADGQWIWFVFQELGGTGIARVRPGDGRIERVVGGEYNIGHFELAGDGAIVLAAEGRNDGPEVYRYARGGLQRLTSANDAYLKSVATGSKRSVSFRSPDGTDVQAFVTLPSGFETGRRYPAILHIHGGPVGQFAWGYDVKAQYLAAQGYVVVQPNPRGSTGRGQDFVRAIYQTWGITDYDDLIAAVDHAIAEGYADPERLAVTGYSYGGYMTNTVITRTDRFRAAASGAGHSLIYANYGHDIYQKWYNWELGVPWENRDKYDRLSPLLQAGKVTTPTLFLGGRVDWNVPLLNAELFYQSLRRRGIDTQLVVYPGVHHGDWPPEYDRDYLMRVQQWFDKYLK